MNPDMPQLFIDLDGVLADFDTHYEKLFGVRPNQDTYDPPDLWGNIRNNEVFYRNLPLMVDALHFWTEIKAFHPRPIVLSGIPYSIPNVAEQKREWVFEHLGVDTQVITCASRDKCQFADPGDILVDDRLKYAKFWINMGGVFVHHISVTQSLQALQLLYTGAHPHILGHRFDPIKRPQAQS